MRLSCDRDVSHLSNWKEGHFDTKIAHSDKVAVSFASVIIWSNFV